MSNEHLNDGLPGAVALLLARGEAAPRSFTAFEDEKQIGTVVICGNGRAPELIVRDKLPAGRNHSFHSLDGFLDYLNSADCATIRIPGNFHSVTEVIPLVETDAHGVVFVGAGRVTANLAYGQLVGHRAHLELTFSEEYMALLRLFTGVSQRDLWRLLITSLNGCIDRGLLLAIGQISITPTGINTVRIDDIGSTNQTVRDSLEITWGGGTKGDKTATIETNWIWTGHLFECFPDVVSIDLRLEVTSSEKGIQFVFHPRQLDTVLQRTRKALVDEIRARNPKHISVYEGIEIG